MLKLKAEEINILTILASVPEMGLEPGSCHQWWTCCDGKQIVVDQGWLGDDVNSSL